ncbi:geranylgeranylglyceryl phosphate synthase-like protein, partial [Fictibacillus macauensis ZFHKF-1]
TDAIFIGGSDGVTLDNTLDLMARVRKYAIPCVLEVSTLESITPGFDSYFIPTVLNSTDARFITGLQHEAVKEYGELMNWEEIVTEGYCIANPECKAAQHANANANLSLEDVVAYARLAEKMLRLPVFYLEYSGVYGDVETVKEASKVLERTKLFYGGGIASEEQAREMAMFADTIVVGNVIYESIDQAVATVKAVKR